MMYKVIDNFFENPDLVRDIALSAEYYTKETHPGDIAQFPGHRTKYLNDWNPHLFQYMVSRQLEISKEVVDISQYTEYWTKFSFSYTTSNVPRIMHVDFDDNWNGFKTFWGGIIYLNPNPPKDTGTILKDVTTVENKYNRYVIYDATKPHAIENSFGDKMSNARLVLTHFIYFK